MKPERENMDNNALKGRFNKLYSTGGFGYLYKEERETLFSVMDDFGGSLLDVGCGDGFWSGILSERFEVTGIDISEEGIEIAKKNHPNVEFILGDFLTCDWSGVKFDTVFLRSPSFLNFDTYSKLFYTNLEKSIAVCSKTLWYIKWSVAPYDRYDDGSYIHDPRKVKEVFDLYGECTLKFTPNYFYAKLAL